MKKLDRNGRPCKWDDIPERDRFFAKVQMTEECWLWIGGLNHAGYGTFGVNGKSVLAHRYAWQLQYGPIPPGSGGYHGTCVLHRCDTPRCVRPSHLFLGTQQDNIADMGMKGRRLKKLTPAQISEIRRRCEAGESPIAVGRDFGISSKLVWHHRHHVPKNELDGLRY